MKIEIVGLSKEAKHDVNQFIFENAREIGRIFDRVSLSRETVDQRIVKLETELHNKNKNRCLFYGLTYIRPNVIYLNKDDCLKNTAQINFELNKTDFNLRINPSFGGLFVDIANTVLIPIQKSSNKDVNACSASYNLRHELAHAGSVRKLRVYRKETGSYAVDFYRSGSVINQGNGFVYGWAISEGHNSIEDCLYSSELSGKIERWRADRFFKEREILDKRYHVETKWFEPELIKNNQGAKNYGYLRRLMIKIYDSDSELFRLTEDFIYGDRIISFARKIDQVFGKDFFGRLMKIGSGDEADKLLQEIR